MTSPISTRNALVIEDDPDAATLIEEQLLDLGFTTVLATDGREGLVAALREDWTLIVVDLNLPSLGGLEICRELRSQKPSQAILVLTANPEHMMSILALELGADEFIRKPFHGLELRARIRALVRRAELLPGTTREQRSDEAVTQADPNSLPTERVTFGDFSVDLGLYRASFRNQMIPLTPTEFELLVLLAQHPNRVFSRDEIVSTLWEASPELYNLNIRFHINNIRAKCKAAGMESPVIKTERGFGYRFVFSGS